MMKCLIPIIEDRSIAVTKKAVTTMRYEVPLLQRQKAVSMKLNTGIAMRHPYITLFHTQWYLLLELEISSRAVA